MYTTLKMPTSVNVLLRSSLTSAVCVCVYLCVSVCVRACVRVRVHVWGARQCRENINNEQINAENLNNHDLACMSVSLLRSKSETVT
jgi:hypothetical protein